MAHMNHYIVPFAYYISDDNEVSPMVMRIYATDKDHALELCKEGIIQDEIKKFTENDLKEERELFPDQDIQPKDLIPSIWLEGEEGDEEGYIIGEPVRI